MHRDVRKRAACTSGELASSTALGSPPAGRRHRLASGVDSRAAARRLVAKRKPSHSAAPRHKVLQVRSAMRSARGSHMSARDSALGVSGSLCPPPLLMSARDWRESRARPGRAERRSRGGAEALGAKLGRLHARRSLPGDTRAAGSERWPPSTASTAPIRKSVGPLADPVAATLCGSASLCCTGHGCHVVRGCDLSGRPMPALGRPPPSPQGVGVNSHASAPHLGKACALVCSRGPLAPL